MRASGFCDYGLPPRGFLRRAATRTFRDRHEAGRALARRLSDHRGTGDAIVYGLARGGVPVAWEVAAALQAPLDVFLVRVLNDDVLSRLGIADGGVREVLDQEQAELTRRERAYRGGRPIAGSRGKTVLLVDDGIATGASMPAAVRAAGPRGIVVAVPVGPESACRTLAREADDVVCATVPRGFQAVGQVYTDFCQIGDDEVRGLLGTGAG